MSGPYIGVVSNFFEMAQSLLSATCDCVTCTHCGEDEHAAAERSLLVVSCTMAWKSHAEFFSVAITGIAVVRLEETVTLGVCREAKHHNKCDRK